MTNYLNNAIRATQAKPEKVSTPNAKEKHVSRVVDYECKTARNLLQEARNRSKEKKRLETESKIPRIKSRDRNNFTLKGSGSEILIKEAVSPYGSRLKNHSKSKVKVSGGPHYLLSTK